jgi:hypothetical protein
MREAESHLSDEELLSAADGELPAQQAKEVAEHLTACWDCRARRARLDACVAGLVEARHREFDSQLPAVAGRRALLKLEMARMAKSKPLDVEETEERDRPANAAAKTFPSSAYCARRILTLGAAAAILLIAGLAANDWRNHGSAVVYAKGPIKPSRTLTPGATRTVNAHELCGAAASPDDDGVARLIPVSTQRQVFREYGIEGAPSKDYEVDFLITPELGGSNDIHNLWPESYHSPVWNAHVKDQLEERLRQMVCDGQLDLGTAQQDISTDWISAYKKYFYTDLPL